MYVWPENPLASLAVIVIASMIFLWAARAPMQRLLTGLGHGISEGLESVGRRCLEASERLRERSREVLLAAGTRDAQARLDRELQRVDAGFSDQLGQFAGVHRRLDDQLLKVESDYQACGVAPPEVPGWSAAVEAIAGIPMTGDPNIQKVLEGIKKSSQEAERKALQAYRDDSARRHKSLAALLPCWKDIRGLLTKLRNSVDLALESSNRINSFVEDYEKIRQDSEESARALTYSAVKLFTVSLLVLGIALGGAFINFQLIALPMSELVPAGARVGGLPVATISALVLVLMEAALGIFIMDMLGVTELFPKLSTIPRSRRRLILWLGIGGLFFLASVESSLAVLREQIVEADAALKLSLAGEQGRVVQAASQSSIPVVGQAVLGFILPWVLALVAVPLEMLLDSGRHVLASLSVWVLGALGHLFDALAHVTRHGTGVVSNLYDVVVSVPLRIESMIRDDEDDFDSRTPTVARRQRAPGESAA